MILLRFGRELYLARALVISPLSLGLACLFADVGAVGWGACASVATGIGRLTIPGAACLVSEIFPLSFGEKGFLNRFPVFNVLGIQTIL